jgi:hypothetical protein
MSGFMICTKQCMSRARCRCHKLGAKTRWEQKSRFTLAGAKDVGNSQRFMMPPSFPERVQYNRRGSKRSPSTSVVAKWSRWYSISAISVARDRLMPALPEWLSQRRTCPWVCDASKEHRRLQPTSILLNPHSGVLSYSGEPHLAVLLYIRTTR